MGTRLIEAVLALRDKFPAQRQGDCGVFSFYYAAHLIQWLHGTSGGSVLSVDPPRKRYHELTDKAFAALGTQTGRTPFHNVALTPKDRHTLDTSIRKFAKLKFKTGQGEIFTEAEMQSIINNYGYGSDVTTTPLLKRRVGFVVEQLAKDRPIIIPYWVGNDGLPSVTDPEPSAHWSVIYNVDSDGSAHMLNPWYPDEEKSASLNLFLRSNAMADHLLYPKIHEKRVKKPDPDARAIDIGHKTTRTEYKATKLEKLPEKPETRHVDWYPDDYPLAETRVPKLNNLLFSLYASEKQLEQMKPVTEAAKTV